MISIPEVISFANIKVVGGGGPPQFGTVFSDAPSSPWKLKAGRAPSGANWAGRRERCRTRRDGDGAQRSARTTGVAAAESNAPCCPAVDGARHIAGASPSRACRDARLPSTARQTRKTRCRAARDPSR